MRFQSTLPERTIQPWKITVVKAKAPLRFICLSKSWINFMTHWDNKRTVVCSGTPQCEYCLGGKRRDYRAFVGAESLQCQQTTITSLTATACDALEKHFLSPRGLLGLSITLHRVPARDTGMLHVMTHGYPRNVAELEHDELLAMLLRIFSINEGVEKV